MSQNTVGWLCWAACMAFNVVPEAEKTDLIHAAQALTLSAFMVLTWPWSKAASKPEGEA